MIRETKIRKANDTPVRDLPEAAAEAHPPHGVREELANLFTAVSSLFSTRIDLARLEYLEARQQASRQLTLFILMAIFLWMAFVAANVLLVVWFWDTPHRLEVLVWIIGVYLLLGALVAWRLAVLRNRASKPFSATLGEFEKDRQWLAAGVRPKSGPSPTQESRDGR